MNMNLPLSSIYSNGAQDYINKVKKETSEDQKVQKKGIELNSELGDELGKELAQASLKENGLVDQEE